MLDLVYKLSDSSLFGEESEFQVGMYVNDVCNNNRTYWTPREPALTAVVNKMYKEANEEQKNRIMSEFGDYIYEEHKFLVSKQDLKKEYAKFYKELIFKDLKAYFLFKREDMLMEKGRW